MHLSIIKYIDSFKLIKTPRFIDLKIQECALKHLELKDMGQLRDRLDGQFYYDSLRRDIIAEYAFEKVIGVKSFDWQKRASKDYVRKQYEIGRVPITILTFQATELPRIPSANIKHAVVIFVNPGYGAYVCGLLNSFDRISKGNKHKDIIESALIAFENLRSFESDVELLELISNKD